VVQANALEFLQEHTGEFDLIIALDVIEHFHKNEVIHFVDAYCQVLRPHGRLIIQTPNADSPFVITHRYNDFTHEVCFNLNVLSRLIRVCGFTEIEGREQGPVTYGYLSSIRWFLWKFIRLLMLAYNLIETGSPGRGILTRVFIVSGIKA
jgi:SAM-dependent methyltransferase